MSTAPIAPKRPALGRPAGSVRAAHVLGVVGILCAVILIPPKGEQPTVLPPYLIYLLFLMLGHYFAAHGVSIATRDDPAPAPLYLPGGVVRMLIVIALGTCIGWKLYDDHVGLVRQFDASLEALKWHPLLPIVILGSFLVGALVNAVLRAEASRVRQDLEAWFSLIALVGLGIAAVMHTIIGPSMAEGESWPILEAILGGMIAFYFGDRK